MLLVRTEDATLLRPTRTEGARRRKAEGGVVGSTEGIERLCGIALTSIVGVPFAAQLTARTASRLTVVNIQDAPQGSFVAYVAREAEASRAMLTVRRRAAALLALTSVPHPPPAPTGGCGAPYDVGAISLIGTYEAATSPAVCVCAKSRLRGTGMACFFDGHGLRGTAHGGRSSRLVEVVPPVPVGRRVGGAAVIHPRKGSRPLYEEITRPCEGVRGDACRRP